MPVDHGPIAVDLVGSYERRRGCTIELQSRGMLGHDVATVEHHPLLHLLLTLAETSAAYMWLDGWIAPPFGSGGEEAEGFTQDARKTSTPWVWTPRDEELHMHKPQARRQRAQALAQ
ncbi:hypothetical protein Q7P37_007536 [Cladosporium fusiforme]